jgi:hypothetical protein
MEYKRVKEMQKPTGESAMRSKIIMFVILCSSAADLSAQEQRSMAIQNQDSAWQRVGRMPAKQKIKVLLQMGEELKGEFVEADANGILLRIKFDKSMNISKGEILRISRRSGGRAALIGLGIGAGAGAGIGASGIMFKGDTGLNRSEAAAGGAVLFGLIGAAAGGIIGMDKTVYESPAARDAKRK